MATDTLTKKSVTLNASGIKFDSAFNTTVTKIINPGENSSIVLASLPNVQISLGSETAKSLGIEKNTQVSIKPIADAADGTFTLEVLETKAKKTATQSSRGSSPISATKKSNDF